MPRAGRLALYALTSTWRSAEDDKCQRYLLPSALCRSTLAHRKCSEAQSFAPPPSLEALHRRLDVAVRCLLLIAAEGYHRDSERLCRAENYLRELPLRCIFSY